MNYQNSKNVSVKRVDTELFAYNRLTGKIHAFNETGAYLVSLLSERSTIKSLVLAISKEYEVDENTAQKDIEEFLEDLIAKGLISERCE